MNIRLLLFLSILCFSQLQAITLQEAIEKSDVKLVKNILLFTNLTSNQKKSFLDLAQNIINKNRDNKYLLFVLELIGGYYGTHFLYGGIIGYYISRQGSFQNDFLSPIIAGLGGLMLVTAFKIYSIMSQQHNDAITIKQLIYKTN